MNNTFKNILSYTLGAILVFSFVALAGTLTPGGNTSTPTMYTLSDIYSKIQNINFTPSAHTVSTSSSPVGTFNTLTQIYTALNDLDYTASDIATGTSIMGITGNISVPPVDKVEDGYFYGANNALEGTLSAGPAPLEWAASDMPAEGEDGGYKTWYAGQTYCAGLSTAGGTKPGVAWRLPTYPELVQLYIDSNGTPSGFQAGLYWSGTTHPLSSDGAYYVDMGSGAAYIDTKAYPSPLVRCAR